MGCWENWEMEKQPLIVHGSVSSLGLRGEQVVPGWERRCCWWVILVRPNVGLHTSYQLVHQLVLRGPAALIVVTRVFTWRPA